LLSYLNPPTPAQPQSGVQGISNNGDREEEEEEEENNDGEEGDDTVENVIKTVRARLRRNGLPKQDIGEKMQNLSLEQSSSGHTSTKNPFRQPKKSSGWNPFRDSSKNSQGSSAHSRTSSSGKNPFREAAKKPQGQAGHPFQGARKYSYNDPAPYGRRSSTPYFYQSSYNPYPATMHSGDYGGQPGTLGSGLPTIPDHTTPQSHGYGSQPFPIGYGQAAQSYGDPLQDPRNIRRSMSAQPGLSWKPPQRS
jgi:hypothetical protein